MFKSKEERVEQNEDRVADRVPKALLNLRARRSTLIVALAAPKPSSLASLLDETRELFYVERAIEALDS